MPCEEPQSWQAGIVGYVSRPRLWLQRIGYMFCTDGLGVTKVVPTKHPTTVTGHQCGGLIFFYRTEPSREFSISPLYVKHDQRDCALPVLRHKNALFQEVNNVSSSCSSSPSSFRWHTQHWQMRNCSYNMAKKAFAQEREMVMEICRYCSRFACFHCAFASPIGPDVQSRLIWSRVNILHILFTGFRNFSLHFVKHSSYWKKKLNVSQLDMHSVSHLFLHN